MNANDQFQSVFKAIMELDLGPIKVKLMHAESGEGWSREKVDALEKEYRRFLCLMKLYPDEDMAPLADVDTFWHYHILDTMKYAVDCRQAFGYFLHHYPYVGLRGDDDEQFRLDSGERMRTLYEATFGEAYSNSGAGAANIAYCGGPDEKLEKVAYCGGPDEKFAKLAYCGGPDEKLGNVAYCGGPDRKLATPPVAAARSTV